MRIVEFSYFRGPLSETFCIAVMPGLKRVFALDVPGIHVLFNADTNEDVDGRVKPGHDE
jgi:hypothetical protein